MANRLQQLLELACQEAAYGPEFYRALLEDEVYALVPAESSGLLAGKLRLVMWNGADGSQVIPFFTSRTAVRRAVKSGWEPFKLNGRTFLQCARGAIVVLNPNEVASCRLEADEVGLLLDSGSVSDPRPAASTEAPLREFGAVSAAPAVMQSLAILYGQHAAVRLAFLVRCWPPEKPDEWYYLIALRFDDLDPERIIRESAQVLLDVPPERAVDTLVFFDDEADVLKLVKQLTEPFYDRAWGSRLLRPSSTRST